MTKEELFPPFQSTNIYVAISKNISSRNICNYQLSHMSSGRDPNRDLRGGRRECYHSSALKQCQMENQNITENTLTMGPLKNSIFWGVSRIRSGSFQKCNHFFLWSGFTRTNKIQKDPFITFEVIANTNNKQTER